jgi:hypothetical protein
VPVHPLPLLCLALVLAGPARAQQAMELPPLEDRAAWEQAWLEVSRGEDGPRAIPRLAIASDGEGWTLSVWGADGALHSVGIQQPHSHADRMDLLYLAISLATPRDDWGWSAIAGAAAPPATEEEELPAAPEDTTAAEPPPPPARPTRSFVSAGPGPTSVSPPLPSEATAAAAPPPLVSPGPDPLAPTPSSSAPTADEPEPEPLDPLFPEPRDPIPILDDPDKSPWPPWAWGQLGAGPTWRPETSPALEGTLRAGWTSPGFRLALALRATTPAELNAFHPKADRSTWDLNLLAGPWVSLGRWVEAGLEGGVVQRRYRQQGRLEVTDTLPTVALELAGRVPAGGLRIGPYLRGTVDLDTTHMENGRDDPSPVDLPLWTLSLGFQAASLGRQAR